MTPYKPHTCDLPQNYELDLLNNFKGLNILSKANDVTNNIANIPATDILNQEIKTTTINLDQQYIGCRYNGSLEQLIIELVPSIILEEEEEDVFYQLVD